jgi:hypothetical protein
MQIRRVQTCSGIVLQLRGDVREGDYVRLRSHFKGKASVIGLDLGSYGGDFEEGLRIADLARREKLTVYVSEECDSACADIFFAAVRRYFGSNSRIGVHSISNDRELEDAESRRMTFKLARLWAKRGVPSSAINKMIRTRPDQISYLDRADLLALEASATNPFADATVAAGQSRAQGCTLQAGDTSRLVAASAARPTRGEERR